MLDTLTALYTIGPSDALSHSRRHRRVCWSIRRRPRRARSTTSSACARWAWARRSARPRRAPAVHAQPGRHVAGQAVRDRGHVRHRHRGHRPQRPTSRSSTRSPRASRPASSTTTSTSRPRSASTGRAARIDVGADLRAPATPRASRCRFRSAITSSSAPPRSTCTSTRPRRCRMGTVPRSLTLDTVNGVTFDVGMMVRLGDRFNIGAHRLQPVGSRQPRVAALARRRPGLHPDSALSINFDTVINFTGYQNYKYRQHRPAR